MILRRRTKTSDTDIKYSDFDGALYLRQNQDVEMAGFDPLKHYIMHGQKEGRPYPAKLYENSPDYIKLAKSGYFDPEWYMENYPDLRDLEMTPLLHFMEHGVWEGRDPGPFFSTSWYVEQYPDTHHQNPLLHYIDHGRREGRVPSPAKNVLSTAALTFGSIADLDPDLYNSDAFYFMKAVPYTDARRRINPVKDVLQELIAEFSTAISHFIMVPWIVHSGSDVVVANILASAVRAKSAESVAVVVVDFDRIDGADWYPPEVKIVNFARKAERLKYSDRTILLEKLLQIVRPHSILNVNSKLTWDLLRTRGVVLSSYAALYACVFCRDYNNRNMAAGYSDTHFRDSVAYLTGVYCDNHTFVRELITQFHLLPKDTDKFQVLKQPPRTRSYATKSKIVSFNTRLNILWAGRFVKQKNYELLAKIINRCDDFHFSIWGSSQEEAVSAFRLALHLNVSVKFFGEYKSFNDIPIADYDVLLYTSLWDGIPNVLVEAGSYGLPIVASDVGGVSELVSPERGWLIEDFNNPDRYAEALKGIAKNRHDAAKRGIALQEFIKEHHADHRIDETLTSPGQFLGSNNA